MAICDYYDMEPLENLTEDLVLEELERQTGRIDANRLSDEAVLDITAYALNQLPPRYSATLTERVYAPTANDPELDERVRTAVASAISLVVAG